MQKTVYLSLGSNMGDRAANLRTAIDRLASLGVVAAVSSFYETEPVEFTAQPWFLNCAVKLSTEKMPRQLLNGVLNIERTMGRRRVKEKGPRIIDIDILLFGKSIVNAKGLNIPQPPCTPGVSYWSRLRKSLQVCGTQCLSGRYASCLRYCRRDRQ